MTTVNIATAAEQPINRHAAVAGEKMVQGDPVAIDQSTGKLVKADAATGTALNAVGVCFPALVDDLADYASAESAVRLAVEQSRSLVDRDRVSFVTRGVELENSDADWTFTPGLPVYLGEGGGYTQTAPSDTGDLVQVMGFALTAERIALAVDPDFTVA
jgi:hypothetical protein